MECGLPMNRLRELGDRQKDLLAILGLFALTAVFFARVLFTGDVLVGDTLARYIPWNYYLDPAVQGPINYEFDTLLAYYPQILAAKGVLQSGSLPLWNPYSLGGVPLLAAAPWLGLCYPLYALFYLVDALEALGYVSFLQLGLAGAFMYLYLRNIDCCRAAAFAGAVSFGLGGFLLGNLVWLSRVSTVIWMPLVFLSVDKLVKREWIYCIVGALAVGMCILAGNLATMLYVLVGSCLYALFRLAQALGQEGMRVAARNGLIMGLALCLGVVLSSVQLVPTFEVSAHAGRVQVGYEERLEGGRSPVALATALVPDAFGNPVDRPWGRNVFAKNIPGTYGETSLYVGIAPLLLGLWAIWRRRDASTVFYACLALLALLIFLDTPVFRALYQLPFFRIGRQLEAKAMWAMAASVLTAAGLETLLGGEKSAGSKTLKRTGVGLVLMAMLPALGVALGKVVLDAGEGLPATGLAAEWYEYNVGNFLRLSLLLLGCGAVALLRVKDRVNKSFVGLLVVGIAFVDLVWFGWKLNPTRQPHGLYPQMDSVDFLQEDDSIYRVIRGPLSRKVFPPNSLTVYGISDAQGYSPVLIDYYVEFLQSIEEEIASSRMVYSLRYPLSTTSPLLDLLNVKYVVTIDEPGDEMTALEASKPGLELVYDGEVKIYENKDVLPRAFFVPSYAVAGDADGALDLLRAEGFDPCSVVILEKEPALSAGTGEANVAGAEVEMVEYGPNAVTVEASTPSQGFLILSDLYYEGWRAFVDGVESEVYKADYAFRAVQLGAGEHRVEFVFDPLSFKIGLALSLAASLSMAVATGMWLVGRSRA
jgi:hypothetical protein